MPTDNSDAPEYNAWVGNILVIEDNPEVLTALELCLMAEGHRVIIASDGIEALDLLAQGSVRPDLILADYNLPRDMNGVQFSLKMIERFGFRIPVIILTGDISLETSRDVASHGYIWIKKPVSLSQLTQTIKNLLPSINRQSPVASRQSPVASRQSPVASRSSALEGSVNI